MIASFIFAPQIHAFAGKGSGDLGSLLPIILTDPFVISGLLTLNGIVLGIVFAQWARGR